MLALGLPLLSVILLLMAGKNLIVVAHPDDETLFFAGLVLQKRERAWDIVCVTDANGDGRGEERFKEFKAACQELGAGCLGFLGYPDIFDKRLDVLAIKQDLFDKLGDYDCIYTHGPTGEYGHPHHQDTSIAVHEAGLEAGIPVWSVAYNSKPDEIITLGKQSYGIKLKLLVQNYELETSRFLNFLNCSYAEAFSQVEIEEVRSIYDCITTGREFGDQLMPHHGMIKYWIQDGRYQESLESFFSNYFAEK